MGDLSPLLLFAVAGVAAWTLVSLAALKAWRGWLEVKRLEITGGGRRAAPTVDIAGLRARVRRLEAIASGIEL
ncbi:MAG: hypothetical protein ACJ8EB_07475 [Allosphingosinicella sp.]